MSTTRHLVAVATLAFAFGTGVSQELPAPQLAVGERWTYQTYDRQFDEGAFTIEVTEQTANGYSLSATEVTAKVPSAIPSSLTLDLNWVQRAANGPEANCWFSFPLVVGRTWTCKTSWINQYGHRGEDNIAWKVVGREQISVKAGTFDTIKIVGEGRWKNNSIGNSDLSTITVWFAPEARGLARYQRDNWPKNPGNPQRRLELVRHMIAK